MPEIDREPSPFGKWLKRAMEARGLGVRQLATYTSLSSGGISQLLTGTNQFPTTETLFKLSRYFHVSTNDLLDLIAVGRYTEAIPASTPIDVSGVVMIPVLDQKVGAGKGQQVLDWEFVSPTVTQGRRSIVAVRVYGSCMAPRIEDGDMVVVDREAGWDSGSVVLAQVDDAFLIKRAIRDENGKVRLHPDNPDFEDVIVDDLAILGVV